MTTAVAGRATGDRDGAAAVRVELDLGLCQGHGVCVSEAPEVFALGKGAAAVTLLRTDVPASLRRKVELAAKHCPTRALTLKEEN